MDPPVLWSIDRPIVDYFRGVDRRLVWLLLFGLAIRLCWVVFTSNPLANDSLWYYEQAINLASGRGYSYRGAPTAIWPVGYPFFLSLVFRLIEPSLLAAKLVNVLLLTLDLALLVYLARLVSKSKTVALLAGLILACAPSHILAASLIATEPLYTCLFHLVLVVLILAVEQQAKALWVLSSALIGLVAYVRPEGGVLLPIALLLRVKTSGQPQRAVEIALLLAMALSTVLVIAPWTIRNWARLGMLIPITTTGCGNLWIGNTAEAEGGFYFPRDPIINPTMIRADDTEQTWYRRTCQAATAAIIEDPVRTVQRLPHKVFMLWKHDHDMAFWNFAGTGRETSPEAFIIYRTTDSYYYLVLALGCIGIVQWLADAVAARRTERLGADHYNICAAALAGGMLAYLPFFGTARFHFALLPLLVIFAAQLLADQLIKRLDRSAAQV